MLWTQTVQLILYFSSLVEDNWSKILSLLEWVQQSPVGVCMCYVPALLPVTVSSPPSLPVSAFVKRETFTFLIFLSLASHLLSSQFLCQLFYFLCLLFFAGSFLCYHFQLLPTPGHWAATSICLDCSLAQIAPPISNLHLCLSFAQIAPPPE